MSLFRPLYRVDALNSVKSLVWKPQIPGIRSFMNIGSMRKYTTASEPAKNDKTRPPVDITPLKLATDLYAVFRIHNRPYLVTEGDKVILPFKMNQAEVGDILKLTDVTTLGSRNFTLKDDPIDPQIYNLKATVIEKTKRKFEIREVTKKRNRRVRHAKRKGDLTILRINKLEVI